MEAQAVRVSLQPKPDLRIVLYDGAKEWYKSVIRFETQDICASEEYLRRSSDIRKKHEKFLRKFSGEKSLRATVLLVGGGASARVRALGGAWGASPSAARGGGGRGEGQDGGAVYGQGKGATYPLKPCCSKATGRRG